MSAAAFLSRSSSQKKRKAQIDEPEPALALDATQDARSEDDEEPLPELDTASSDASDGDLSDAAILRELEEEEALERQLQDDEESDDSDDPHIARRSLSNADALARPGSLIPDGEKNRMLGFDTRDYARRAQRVTSAITGEDVREWAAIEPGYDSDSASEAPNRVGNIPAHFYDGLPHVGYDIDGRRVMRPAKGDELDRFLSTVDADGAGWTSVTDRSTGQDVELTNEELELIQRLARAENPDPSLDRAWL